MGVADEVQGTKLPRAIFYIRREADRPASCLVEEDAENSSGRSCFSRKEVVGFLGSGKELV